MVELRFSHAEMDICSDPRDALIIQKPLRFCLHSPLCLGGGGPENVDYNFHSPADTNASIVGSHFWVYVLQLPRAGQATHTPAYFCWTRTLVIVRKHVLQLCTPRHSYIYQARGVAYTSSQHLRIEHCRSHPCETFHTWH